MEIPGWFILNETHSRMINSTDETRINFRCVVCNENAAAMTTSENNRLYTKK